MPGSRGLSRKGSNIPYSFRTFVPLIIIAAFAIGLSLLSYQYSILTSEKIATAATQDLKDNARIQAYDMSKSLENRLASIRSNLEILANAPLIELGGYSQARVLVNTAENSTEGFTDSYFWIDEMGKLQWAGAFVDQKVYDQYYGGDRTDRPYFTEPRDTHQPYFSTLRDSVDGVPRVYVAYPIMANSDSSGTFKGVVAASMNLKSLGNSINEQLPPDSQGTVSLMDRDGTILYTQNDTLAGKNYFSDEVQSLLFTNYVLANQKDTFNAIVQDSVAGNSGTGEYSSSSSGVPLILAYNPVMFDQGSGNRQHAMSLHLTLPKAFASDIALLIEQQRNLSTIVPAAIGTVAIALALMIIRWNSKLERTVKERTAKLEAANEQLEAQERAQREFINIAAHELRTPIQPILGLSEIIREGILNLAKQLQMVQGEVVYKQLQNANTIPARSDSINRSSSLSPSIEEIVPMVDVINRNAKRLEKLTSNLLDVSRIENNKSLELSNEKFDLRQKIENVINDMRSVIPNNKDIQIKFESKVRKAPVMVEGDRERIFEVISNLLSNAIKFTQEGEVVVVLDEKDGQAIVSVRDTGSGIAPEIYPNLFTKFTTKSEKGTGLGLFIAKNIIEAHGGKIWAENNSDGRGAMFTFILPTLTHDTEDMANEKRNPNSPGV
ncbi:MAG: ATP-binding protein [Thermoproteota archaeon]|nr:ATP-binding protein [Thermoproteota archaeon]